MFQGGAINPFGNSSIKLNFHARLARAVFNDNKKRKRTEKSKRTETKRKVKKGKKKRKTERRNKDSK